MYVSCRICKKQDTRSNVIVPCLCKDDSKYIHKTCLDKIRASNEGLYDCCQNCNHKFVLIKSRIPKRRLKFVEEESMQLFLLCIGISTIVICMIVNFNLEVDKQFIEKYQLPTQILLYILLKFILIPIAIFVASIGFGIIVGSSFLFEAAPDANISWDVAIYVTGTLTLLLLLVAMYQFIYQYYFEKTLGPKYLYLEDQVVDLE